jgi:hypothetical protein
MPGGWIVIVTTERMETGGVPVQELWDVAVDDAKAAVEAVQDGVKPNETARALMPISERDITQLGLRAGEMRRRR